MLLREVRETDLSAVAEMIDDFVKGHPAENHPRSLGKLRTAYLGDKRVANLLVAIRREHVVGMVQWSLLYDQFWAMFGVHAEWLYVRPEARGLGIAAAMIADVCARARRTGAEFLRGGANSDALAQLYGRFAIGGPAYECHVSAEAFQVFADLAGKPVREIVRGLPARELGRVPPRPREL
ncbi:MAG TPA: GNAT family N-acetyltransferase [Kofleriaceae bacterium]